jgi:L-ascorbate metabolism protein UlaG (beta-lactamase superfamily)
LRRLTEFALVAILATTVPGCFVFRAGVRGMGALVSSPREVTKTKHPVTKDARLAVVWVGHATALVQMDDKVILTDPVFTNTVGTVSKRLVEPGIDPKDLPPVDVALVSHLHYDHFSLGSLDMIERKVRTLLMPLGGAAYITDGFSFPIHELRTWQTWEKDGLRVTAVPVDHVGGRYGLDATWMTQSFTGYLIEYKDLKVYFGGDTAYEQRYFVEVAQRFPKIDLALLPIGPTEPRSIMRQYHMDPFEAVQAFVDLDATRMVPIHYGTFINAEDEPGDALKQLAAAQKKTNLGPKRLVAPLAIGERRVFIKVGESNDLPVPVDATFPPPTTGAPPAPSAAPAPKIPDDDSFE